MGNGKNQEEKRTQNEVNQAGNNTSQDSRTGTPGNRTEVILKRYIIVAVCVFVACCAFAAGTMFGQSSGDSDPAAADPSLDAELPLESAPAEPSADVIATPKPTEDLSPAPTPVAETISPAYRFIGNLGVSFQVPSGFNEEDFEVDGGYGYRLKNRQYNMEIQITEAPFEALSRTENPADVFANAYQDSLNEYENVTDTRKNNSWSDRSWRKSSYDVTGYADEETIFFVRLYNRSDEMYTRVQFLYPKSEREICDELLVDFLSSVDYSARPSNLDIRDLNELTGHSEDYVQYPNPQDYLDSYEIMYTTKDFFYYRTTSTLEEHKTGAIPYGTEVTVLAIQNSRTFVVFASDNGYRFGWCYSPWLSY